MNNKKVALVLSILSVMIIVTAIVINLVKKDDTVISNYKWKVSNDSVIYFYQDKTFKWYKDDNDHNNNYYYGEYEVYNSDDAIDYISNELSSYGITKDEQRRFIESGYKKENYYALVIKNQYLLKDGVKTSLSDNTHYYGFYIEKESQLNLVNMDTANTANFTRIGKIK